MDKAAVKVAAFRFPPRPAVAMIDARRRSTEEVENRFSIMRADLSNLLLGGGSCG